jgi:hypothetical protein
MVGRTRTDFLWQGDKTRFCFIFLDRSIALVDFKFCQITYYSVCTGGVCLLFVPTKFMSVFCLSQHRVCLSTVVQHQNMKFIFFFATCKFVPIIVSTNAQVRVRTECFCPNLSDHDVNVRKFVVISCHYKTTLLVWKTYEYRLLFNSQGVSHKQYNLYYFGALVHLWTLYIYR